MAPSGGAPNTPPNGPPPSAIQTSPNLVSFDPKAVVPSQSLYFQRNDQLFFNVLTNLINTTIRVRYRWLTPQGEIKEGQFDSPIFSNTFFFQLPLYEGWLLSFTANINVGAIPGQWCYLQAEIARAVMTSSVGPIQGIFWEGFLSSNSLSGWPGSPTKEVTDGAGVLRSITGSTPAAGAEINEIVPSNRRWNLLAFTALLTTSVTVANRNPSFFEDDGVNPLTASPAFLNQVASTTFRYVTGQQPTTAAPLAQTIVLEFPVPIPMKGGFRFRSTTPGLQAGDQWSALQYLVQEWGQWDS